MSVNVCCSGHNFLECLTSPIFFSSAGKDSSTQNISNATKSVEKEAAAGKLEGDKNNPEVFETSLAVDDDNVQDTNLVQVSTVKTVEVSDHRAVRVTQPCFDD